MSRGHGEDPGQKERETKREDPFGGEGGKSGETDRGDFLRTIRGGRKGPSTTLHVQFLNGNGDVKKNAPCPGPPTDAKKILWNK